ncbi:L-type lectin-domain containing receptor kinase IV.1-like [Chenopodium quinoa]|uniref:Legume lectin domain-containing protein n=1 Tax=Chenopodium quinoa TaxID=63459 RepID=A0A803NAE1_CHEQI|nr:L-type lectin-domain containing receptor kinase IV.1-like [Chenopodium quinoa]
MAMIFSLRYSLILYFAMFFCFMDDVLVQSSSTSFGFKNFGNNSKFLDSEIGFYGEAKVDENGSFVELTESHSFSSGRVMYRKPIKLMGRNGSRKASFGTYFTFSLSSEDGDGILFVMLPKGYSSGGYNGKLFGLSNELIEKKNRAFFAVEFDTKFDAEFGDLSNNHVGIDVGSLVSVKVTNGSDLKLKLSSGKKLQCWIDYEASSKRIEVRMSKEGEERSVSPLLSCPVDLSEMFKGEEVFFGLSSSNANSSQVCRLYSWSFKLRPVPYWMHSYPLDPKPIAKDAEAVVMIRQKSDCKLKVLTALILGTVCGALGAYIVMFVWSVFVSKKPVAPEEYMIKPVMYDYDKVHVLAVDKSDDGMNSK